MEASVPDFTSVFHSLPLNLILKIYPIRHSIVEAKREVVE
jgi:hypothetical protein